MGMKGYSWCFMKCLLFSLFSVLSIGLLPLFTYYYPFYYTLLTKNQVKLHDATHVYMDHEIPIRKHPVKHFEFKKQIFVFSNGTFIVIYIKLFSFY